MPDLKPCYVNFHQQKDKCLWQKAGIATILMDNLGAWVISHISCIYGIEYSHWLRPLKVLFIPNKGNSLFFFWLSIHLQIYRERQMKCFWAEKRNFYVGHNSTEATIEHEYKMEFFDWSLRLLPASHTHARTHTEWESKFLPLCSSSKSRCFWGL